MDYKLRLLFVIFFPITTVADDRPIIEPETLDEVAQAVESINDEAVRAAQIIDRVRSWSQGRVNRQVLEADQGVKRAVQSFMLTNRSRGISIRTGVLQSVKVWMDPLELELIVVNLLSNAAEAARKYCARKNQ